MVTKLARFPFLVIAALTGSLHACTAQVEDFHDRTDGTAQTLGADDDNALVVTARGLASFEGKTVNFVAGSARGAAKVTNGRATARLEGAVRAGTFGEFVYAYFSPGPNSSACADMGPVFSEFVSTAGRTGQVIRLTMEQNEHNQFTCKKLVQMVAGVKLAPDTRPRFADALVRATGFGAHEGKKLVVLAKTPWGTSLNTAIVSNGQADLILKDAVGIHTFGSFISAFVNADGRGAACAEDDAAWQTFASPTPGPNGHVQVELDVRSSGLVTEVDCETISL